MTTTIAYRSHHSAPAARPQPIAFHEGTLWVGCWETPALYAIDPASWTVRESIAVPGIPYGLASFDGALRVVVSIGEADDRYLYRFVPGTPFTEDGRVGCPELTGSHLTSDGVSLYLVQQTHRRMLELGAGGATEREIGLPTRCAGIAADRDGWYMISADDEFDVLELGTLDITGPNGAFTSLAAMDAEARGLAFDGSTWWTSRREVGEIVNFSF